MISSAVPLSAIAEALDARLPSATSSQLPVLHRLRRNLDARCAQIEQSVKPTATAPRPLVGQSRPREAARPPPPPRVRRRRAAGAAGAIMPRRPAGLMTPGEQQLVRQRPLTAPGRPAGMTGTQSAAGLLTTHWRLLINTLLNGHVRTPRDEDVPTTRSLYVE